MKSAGERFREVVGARGAGPLAIVGVVNGYCGMLAERAGFSAGYVSGAGVANASYGLPDLGMTSLENVLEDVRRIGGACGLPLLVDIDTGWGGALNIERAVREMERGGAGAVHIEDQVLAKRCGHRPGKAVVEDEEMCDRVRAAAGGRKDASFVIMARTDAAAMEGVDRAIERANKYVAAGADMVFAEALTSLEEYRKFCGAINVPVLANSTEFGKTPLFTREELGACGVAMVLYPLSAFRAMSRAAEKVYETILKEGTQKSVVGMMQTREELYGVLGYHEYERRIDAINKKGG